MKPPYALVRKICPSCKRELLTELKTEVDDGQVEYASDLYCEECKEENPMRGVVGEKLREGDELILLE